MAVRRESVVIDGTDNLTPILLREAAAAKLLNRELRNLSGININVRGLANVEKDIVKTSRALDDGGNSLDSFSGRAGLALQAVGALGAGLIPIGALALPAITGLTAAVGSLAVAGAGAVIAFQGVGDATKALDAYDLEPTAANLEKAQQAMAAIGPDAQRFVMEFQKFQPVLTEIRDSAAAGLFPGLTQSLDDFEAVAPQVEKIFRRVGEASGQVVADTAESLNSERWRPFMDFIAAEAPAAITSLAASVGDLGHGLASMLMASDSGSDAFLGWVENVADGFDDWASSSRGREDIAAFLDYVEQTGPAVGEFFGSLVNAVAQIVQAAAPLGGPVLKGLTAVTDVIGNIADSDLGTPIMLGVAALSVYSRSLATVKALQASTFGKAAMGQQAAGLSAGGILGGRIGKQFEGVGTAAKSLRSDLSVLGPAYAQAGTRAERLGIANESLKKNLGTVAGGAAKTGAAIAGLAVLSTGAADGLGVTNTASLALMGTMVGPWGAAIGGAAGAVLDFRAANEDLAASMEAANTAARAGDIAAFQTQATAARRELDEGLGDGWLNTSQNIAKGLFRDVGAGLGVVKQSTGEVRNELSRLDSVALAMDWGDQLFDFGIESEGGRIKEVGAAIGSIGSEADTAAAGAERLQAALDGLLSPTLDAEAATDQWRASLQALRTELDSNAGFTSMTEAGRANKALTRQVVEDTQTRLTAMAADGAGQGKLAASLKETRRAFVANGVAAGFDVGVMRRRANAIGLTPKLVKTVFQSLGAAGVQKQAANLRRIYNQLPASVKTDIKANGIPKSRADVNSLVRQYNLTPKQKTTLMRLVTAAAMGNGKAVQALLRQIGGLKPTPKAGLDIGGLMKGAGTARNSLNQVGGLRPKPKIDADPSGAISGANAAKGAIAGVQGKTVTITTVYRDVRQGVSAAKSAQKVADGGYISGPGGPRDDLIPAMLSNGEFVINAAATRRNLPLLEDLNAQKFAEGGLVQNFYDRLEPQHFATGGEVRDRNRGGGNGPGNKQRQRGGMSPEAREAMREVRDILEPINKAFRRDLKKADDRGERLDAFRDRVKASTEALKKETDQRKKITEDMRSFASEVTGAYRHDIFGNGLAGLQLQLDADANDARKAMADLGLARKNGLDGGLLEALQKSGDTNTISQIAGLDRAGIAALERQYASSMAATGALGNQAAQIKFGEQLADQNRINSRLERTVDELRREVRQLGGRVQKGAEKGSNKGAHSGTARGNRDNDKATTRGTRSTGRGGGRRNR